MVDCDDSDHSINSYEIVKPSTYALDLKMLMIKYFYNFLNGVTVM
jgi:hypothetical protein